MIRSRTINDNKVMQFEWDCLKLKKILKDNNDKKSLQDTVKQIAKIDSLGTNKYPKHFLL